MFFNITKEIETLYFCRGPRGSIPRFLIFTAPVAYILVNNHHDLSKEKVADKVRSSQS